MSDVQSPARRAGHAEVLLLVHDLAIRTRRDLVLVLECVFDKLNLSIVVVCAWLRVCVLDTEMTELGRHDQGLAVFER